MYGVGLPHTQEEYEQYAETEVNAIQELVSRAHARGLEAEQLLLDKTDILKDDVSKYNALYTKVRRDAEVDPERTFAENWTAITLLATFIDDAVESAKDQDIADLVVSPEKVAGDLNDILYDYGRAYPALAPAAEAARAIYTLRAEGKDFSAALVIGLSETPKVQAGEIVLFVNDRPTTQENLKELVETISLDEVRTLALLRSGKRVDVDLTKEENDLIQFLML